MAAPTESSIRQRVGTRSFDRGAGYFRQGHVHDARRQGDVLKARCHGADDHDYRVEVRLDGAKIVSGRCTCPVGHDGTCKHVAAMLLNWREQPADFEQTPDLATLLSRRDKAELIELIAALVDAEPALEEIVESAVLTEAGDAAHTTESVQRTVTRVLERLSEGGDPAVAAAAIHPLAAQAGRLCAAGEVERASAIGAGIVAAAVAHYDANADMTGDVARGIDATGAVLARCFAGLPEQDPRRGPILQSLFALLQFDVCVAGAGLAGSVSESIAAHATREEIRQVIAWVREIAPPSRRNDPYEAWQRECWGALIADLVGTELDDEEYLEHCRQFGLTAARVARLLELERSDDALQAAGELEEPQLPEVAELFVRRGRAADAVQLMQCRAADSPAAAAWLMDYYEERGKWDDALEWRRHEFEQHPDLVNYRAVRRAAQKAKQWPELADELVETAQRVAEPQARVQILLEAGRVEDARAELERVLGAGLQIGAEVLEDVARALEQADPERAIDLYLQVAERLITSRRAKNYASASKLLGRARSLYEQTGRQQDWKQCIAAIASRHSRRRALQQQLKRAKLLT